MGLHAGVWAGGDGRGPGWQPSAWVGWTRLRGVRGNLIGRVGGLPTGVVVGRGRGSPVPPAPGVLGRGHAKASGGGRLPVAICARESLSLRRSLWWSLGRFPVGSQWSLRQACNPSSVLSRVLSSSLFLSFVRSLSLSLSPSLSLSLSLSRTLFPVSSKFVKCPGFLFRPSLCYWWKCDMSLVLLACWRLMVGWR